MKLKYSDKVQKVEDLNTKIKETEKSNREKDEVIGDLSDIFNNILEEFEFPKLSNAFIDVNKYLPHVRNRQYDELGSLGAVTLITTAYYLSILLLGTTKEYNHLGLLIIDSPQSNLGASSNEDDDLFKDEKIYQSVVRYLVSLSEEYEDEFQILVVNNGYPNFLDSKYIIKEFDGNGTRELPYGLIDDIKS
ncbi:MAG: hypothetical protein FH761_15320 [Firmicutes bacterium]|nr:hypothetical protein [Bacillota bacterium]